MLEIGFWWNWLNGAKHLCFVAQTQAFKCQPLCFDSTQINRIIGLILDYDNINDIGDSVINEWLKEVPGSYIEHASVVINAE